MENFSLDNDSQITTNRVDDAENVAKLLEDHQFSLLEEKLVVKRRKQKVGEVVVRKKIETKMIHLPIRREKLIVEKVGVTDEHLAEIDLGEGEVNGVKFSEITGANDIYLAQSNFVSPEVAQELLTKIVNTSTTANIKMRLEIVTDNSELQETCQDICDR
ncbi:DUF2382 domain-containing protein [Pleurocapsales cyanobacterium LEGE 10410]|nr:DUF2382 domain-containing protein [Pleurocapsales cyanobacterium LEGE 10410]